MRLILVFILSLIYPIWIVLTSLLVSGINRNWIKLQMIKSNAYPVLVESLNKTVNLAISNNNSEFKIIAPLIKKEITSDLVKSKAEKLIDDTTNWITGKTNNAPSISLIELKSILISQNPEIANQLSIISKVNVKNEIPLDPEYDYGIAHPAIGSVVDQAINDKLNFPIGKYFPILRQILPFVKIIYGIVTVTILIIFGMLYLLSGSLKFRLRWFGSVGVILTLANSFPFLILLSPALLFSLIAKFTYNIYITVIPILIKPMIYRILIGESVITVIVLLSSLFLLIISVFMQDNSS
jgi:hypothetical protein